MPQKTAEQGAKIIKKTLASALRLWYYSLTKGQNKNIQKER
jgi:hypothetical protein